MPRMPRTGWAGCAHPLSKKIWNWGMAPMVTGTIELLFSSLAPCAQSQMAGGNVLDDGEVRCLHDCLVTKDESQI